MDGSVTEIIRAVVTAGFGVFLLAAAVQGWVMGAASVWYLRIVLLIAALMMIEGGLVTDLLGLGTAAAVAVIQRMLKPGGAAAIPVRGAD